MRHDRCHLRLFLLLIPLLFSGLLSAQETAPLITYGPGSKTGEGDDDFKQAFFFKIPASNRDSLYIRLFDPDVGGTFDAVYGTGWNSTTRFRLYGGAGAYSTEGTKSAILNQKAFTCGTILGEIETGSNPFYDNLWVNFWTVLPEKGEVIDGWSYFKLTVEGLTGDDGNIYEVRVSDKPDYNSYPKDLTLYTFTPTLRVPRLGTFAELRFDANFITNNNTEGRTISIHNFDLAEAPLSVETYYRSGLSVVSSKN